MIHFSPLEGDSGFENKEMVLNRAKQDLEILLEGGVDAILFENNFDLDKDEKLTPAKAEHFRELVKELTPDLDLPWGLVPLWNDFELGFRLCKEFGGIMVRVPVFVDDVKTVYGVFKADAKKVLTARQQLGADDVMILADVHVKHAEMIKPRPLVESLQETIDAGADAVIITGEWTGDPPDVEECRLAKETAQDKIAVLTGSGLNADNLKQYTGVIDGCIVGTAFKEGEVDTKIQEGPNVTNAARRYDLAKVQRFMAIIDKYKNV